MSGFGIRKHNTGRAIVRFLIGLLVIAVCVLVFYEFVLNGDFSGLMNNNVENALPLGATKAPEATSRFEIIRGSEKPVSTEETDLPGGTPTDAVVPGVTPQPTPEPTPQPTPEPTPAVTPIPESEFSALVTTFGKAGTAIRKTPFKIEEGQIENGLTAFEISAPNENKVISLTGWGYADSTRFDGANCVIYIIIIDSKGAARFYEPTIVSGITGMVHEGKGKNLNMCEFMATIDVSDLADGSYQIGVGVQYKPGSTTYRYAYTFGEAYNFTTVGGAVTSLGGVEVS